MTIDFAIAHPMRLDGLGRVAGAAPADHLEQMIWLALLTAPGERINRPDFGAGLTRLVFEGGDGASASLRLELRAYLQRLFAGKLTIEELRLDRDGNAFQITLAYRATEDDARRVTSWRINDSDPSLPVSSSSGRVHGEPGPRDAALAALDHRPLPWIDYLARDYDSFREAMLERLTALAPRWTERNPADVGIALIEALAHAADCLSYKQDAIGAEAHLATAQLRPSIARHARLRDERLLEGTNARVWVHIAIAGERRFRLPAGTRLLTRVGAVGAAVSSKWQALGACIDRSPDVFMTLHAIELVAHLNAMPLVAPDGGVGGVLAAGATSATLAGHADGLAAGDVLILEVPDRPLTDGMLARQPVRLSDAPVRAHDAAGRAITHIRWHDDDRLGVALPIGVDAAGAPLAGAAVAHGNIVLADAGDAGAVALPPVSGEEPYRPYLDKDGLVWSTPFDPGVARQRSALSATRQDVHRSVAALMLEELDHRREVVRRWYSRADLLASHRFAGDFVAERHREGALLRFGEGGAGGERPRPGARFIARYRHHVHRAAAIGPGAIAHLVTNHAALRAAIRSVTNPLASTMPEPPQSIDEARWLIPARAARGADGNLAIIIAMRLRGQADLADSLVERRWSNGHEMFACCVLPTASSPLIGARDAARLTAALGRDLPAGTIVEVRGPDLVPLAVDLAITLSAHGGEPQARAAVHHVLDDGEGGLFGPGRRMLGRPVRLVDLRDAVAAIAGVAVVEVRSLRALTGDGPDAVLTGQITCSPRAIIVGPISSSPARGDLRLTFRRQRNA